MKSSWKKQRLVAKKRSIKRSRHIKQEFEKFVIKFIDDIRYIRNGLYRAVKKVINGLSSSYKQKIEVI